MLHFILQVTYHIVGLLSLSHLFISHSSYQNYVENLLLCLIHVRFWELAVFFQVLGLIIIQAYLFIMLFYKLVFTLGFRPNPL